MHLWTPRNWWGKKVCHTYRYALVKLCSQHSSKKVNMGCDELCIRQEMQITIYTPKMTDLAFFHQLQLIQGPACRQAL